MVAPERRRASATTDSRTVTSTVMSEATSTAPQVRSHPFARRSQARRRAATGPEPSRTTVGMAIMPTTIAMRLITTAATTLSIARGPFSKEP